MDISQLEKIGLKEKGARIYLELLREGPSLANSIAKKTKILRSSIYDYFDLLVDKGFVTYSIVSGKKYFQAVDPEKILDRFEEDKEREEEILKGIVKELSVIKPAGIKTKTEIFEGKEGMKSAMNYILKEKPDEILSYGSSGISHKLLPYFMVHWHKKRISNKIPGKVIYNDTPEAKDRIEKGPSLKLAKVKFLPIKSSSITGTIIYGNKVLITIWSLENPIAISIENEEVAKNYKDNFSLLWKQSKK